MTVLLKFCSKSFIILLELCWLLCWTTVYSGDITLPKIGISSVHQGAYFGDVGPEVPNLNLTYQNETVYLLPSTIGELTLDCNATYPIMWNLAQSNINSESFPWIRIRSSRIVSDIFDPSTFNYTTQLILSAPGESFKLTGNYSCQSTAKSDIQSNIFVFWEGTRSLVHSRETLTAYLENERVTLPCGISNPRNAWPVLRKEPKGSRGTYQELKVNDSISYKTTEGFIFNNLPDPIGKYKCLFGDGVQDFVIVNVKELNATQVAIKKAKSNATFTYNTDTNEIVCCSSSKKAPRIVFLHCSHAVTCQFREHVMQSYHFILSRSKKKKNCASRFLRFYHTGLIRCIGNGIDEYKEVISPIQTIYMPWNLKMNSTTTTFFRWEEIESQDMLMVRLLSQRFDYNAIIRNNPKKPIYSKQQLSVECRISNYYFSEGTQWAIRWKNKTLTPPAKDKQDTNARIGRYYSPRSNVLNIESELDMEALVCYAPVWNSSVWITKTYFMYINESIVPTLKDSKVEEYTWYTNETGKVLTCEATGIPDPKISWKKGEQDLTSYTHNYNISRSKANDTNVVTSTLKILRITYSSHGEYTCNVKNYAGVVSRTFRVTVVEKGSWGTATLLIVSGLIVCTLLGIIFFFLHRMKKDRKAIQHLTSVHFKDPSTRENAIGTDVNNTVHDNGKMTNQLIS